MNQQKYSTIKDWAEDDRPREKLVKHGPRSLSNAELLAILIRTGTKKHTAVDLARQLLKEAQDNLNKLATFDLEKYNHIPGLGITKAVTIMAAMELGNRRLQEKAIELPQFKSSRTVYEFLRSLFGDSTTEEAWLLTLNQANKLINYYQISKGGFTATVIDIRSILKQALYDNATAIIIAHNHPSGNTEPSEEDKKLTQKLKTAAEHLEIRFLDHLIITQYNYYSFADEGTIL